MAEFSYKAINSQGKVIKGSVEAPDARSAVRLLKEQRISVLDINEGGAASFSFQKVLRCLHLYQYLPVTSSDRILFFRQISLMITSGHTLAAALDSTSEMQSKRKMTLAIKRMADEIRRGSRFSACLESEKHIFSSMITNLVAVGERSGNLGPILSRLADNIERSKAVKFQLISAMFYPTFVMLVSVAVICFMIGWVIPRFETFLTARNAELPKFTQMVVEFSRWAQDWGLAVIVTASVSIFLTLASYTTVKGKRFIDRILLRLPLLGKTIQYAAMAQTGWTLSLLLRSGLPAMESLRINGGAMGNLVIGDGFVQAADELLVGSSLSSAFEQPHFPLMMRHMAAVGEKSGEVDHVMNELGVYYQKELETKVKLIAAMVEPVMILGVGGVVGSIYLSLIMAVIAASKGGM